MSKGTSKLIVAMVAGFAAGVAAGLLFAPEKGTVTRKKMKKNILDLSEDLEKNVSENLDDLKSVFTGEKTKQDKGTNE